MDKGHASRLFVSSLADPCRVLLWLLDIADGTCGYFVGVDVVEVGCCLEVTEVDGVVGRRVSVDEVVRTIVINIIIHWLIILQKMVINQSSEYKFQLNWLEESIIWIKMKEHTIKQYSSIDTKDSPLFNKSYVHLNYNFWT